MPFRASNKARQFIYEGALLKAKSGRKIQAVLFNDFFFLLELKNSSIDPAAATEEDGKIYNLYRPPMRVAQTTLREMDGDETGFHIVSRSDAAGGAELIVNVRAASAAARAKWLAAMQRARNWRRNVQQNAGSPTQGARVDLLL